VKYIFSSQAVQKEAAGRIWPAGRCLPTPALEGLENFGYESKFMKDYKQPVAVSHLPVTGNVATFI
jgi:hypothetical protein